MKHRTGARMVGAAALAVALQLPMSVRPAGASAAVHDGGEGVPDLAEDNADRQADAADRASVDDVREPDLPEDRAADALDGPLTAGDEVDAADTVRDDSGADAAAGDRADAETTETREAGDSQEGDKDSAKDGTENGSGGLDHEAAGASELQDLTSAERPDFDERGYPVQHGEIVALDLSQAARATVMSQGFSILETRQLGGAQLVLTRLAVPPGMRMRDALASLRRTDPGGVFDYSHYYALNYRQSGYRDGGGALSVTPRSWSPGRGGPRVGMIDTGLANHPALAGVRVRSQSFSSAPEVQTEHGTAVASLLIHAGAGEIVAADVFRGNDQRSYTSAESIAEALGWMVDQRVLVINMSLAGPRNMILDRVIARLLDSGRIIVAAAGNGGPTAPPAYPAAQQGVVGVTAVDARGRVYRYANQGPYIDVAALGVGVPAAAPGGWIAPHSGTSYAAPHVAVVLARCARQAGRSNASCVTNMERRARDLGRPGRDAVYGFGLVE